MRLPLLTFKLLLSFSVLCRCSYHCCRFIERCKVYNSCLTLQANQPTPQETCYQQASGKRVTLRRIIYVMNLIPKTKTQHQMKPMDG